MTSGLVVSRYAIVSDDVFADADGRPCRLVYVTRTARVSRVTRALGDALHSGQVDALPRECTDELTRLRILGDHDTDEVSEVLRSQRAAAGSLSHRQYVLLPTRYCNMACGYCGQEHVKGRMTDQHRDRVVARVLRGIAAPATESVGVGWFGAEPMMAYATIRDMSAQFVAAARTHGRPYSARMTTNGVLLTPRKLRVLHDECLVRGINVTIDGVGEEHDRHRPLKSGGSSYGRIVDALRYAVVAVDELPNLKVTIRTNVDVNNVDGITRMADEMVAAGLTGDRVDYELHAVYSWSNDVSDIRIQQADFAVHEVQMLRTFLDRGLDITVLPNKPVSVTCVAVAMGGEVHSPTGTVFTCTEHPLVDRHEKHDGIATLAELPIDVVRPRGPFDGWYDEIDEGKVPCRGCELLPVCGGSCPKHWGEGDPPCPSLKFNVQARLRLLARSRGLALL
ncbi:radical SAM protein [Actinokineospora sp. 24-640]